MAVIRKKFITLERVHLRGKMEDSEKAFRWLEKNNYHVIRSGPKMITRAKADPRYFHIIGEKEVTE